MTPEALLEDFALFSDLGTDPPYLTEFKDSYVIRLTREGQVTTLTLAKDGHIIERTEDNERRHASLRALLASPHWANLGRWADSQRTLLHDRILGDTIDVSGRLSNGHKHGGVDLIDTVLSENNSEGKPPRTFVLLIDGPAGIGKTSIIRSLAYKRANNFRREQRPLILHVESRGRVLQNITDLMAFSLQTLRLSVTYDQVPVLVRHGLVTLAIDGFDELGDPNGYDLAWAQVNELITEARGQGRVILAGRETFIGRERMRKALTAVDESVDRLEAFTLQPIDPNTARSWLSDKGWSNELIRSQAIDPLFEPDSYALRPFFLSELAREGVPQQIEEGKIGDLLDFLVSSMAERESTKFGKDIEAITKKENRVDYIMRLMEEIARDLAENQSNAIPVENIAWLSEIAAEDIVPASLYGILKNRSGVIAFLKDDDRRGYKAFVHEQVYNYFLSRATIRSIIRGETPKFIRRNIFGTDFLESFSDVFRLITDDRAENFIQHALSNISNLTGYDRARQNIASLVMSACCVYSTSDIVHIKDVAIDEAYLSETLAPLKLDNVIINQLTAIGADMRAVKFDKNSVVVSLIADEGTVLSSEFPIPTVMTLPTKTTYDPKNISEWLYEHSDHSSIYEKLDIALKDVDIGIFDLLGRVARYKPFWIKDGDEKGARRILDDENWPTLKNIMIKHNFLIERTDVPASGRPAPFYHVRNRSALMDLEYLVENTPDFIVDLVSVGLNEKLMDNIINKVKSLN